MIKNTATGLNPRISTVVKIDSDTFKVTALEGINTVNLTTKQREGVKPW